MTDQKKKEFSKPELIKFDKPLDEVTLLQQIGSVDCDKLRPPIPS
jgi:hypothetical protein